jgi:hypothetical protein
MLRKLLEWTWKSYWTLREWDDHCEYPWNGTIHSGDQFFITDHKWGEVSPSMIGTSLYKIDRGLIRRDYREPQISYKK